MTASSFRAGIMAETVSGEDAGTKAPRGELFCSLADISVLDADEALRDQGVSFLTYRDPSTRDNHSPIAQTYGTSMYPETYVIDRHGKIARKFIGFQHWDSPDMLAYFDSILGQT